MNRLQVQLGFILILLGLLTGFGAPLFVSPRLGLASHVVGITGGLILIAFGSLANAFLLGRRAKGVMVWSWVYAAYANWLGCLIAALTGASRLTPIAGAGTKGDALSEAVVTFLLMSLAFASIAGTALAVWGFRRPRVAATPHAESLSAV